MPLVAIAALAYAVGTFVSQVWPGPAAVAFLSVTLLGGLAGVARAGSATSRPHAVLLLVAAGGALFGTAAIQRRAACAHALRGALALEITFETAARAGAAARGTATLGSCSAHATVIPQKGTARPGERVATRGTVHATARGILVDGAALGAVVAHPLLPTLRARTGARIDRLFQGDAALVRALVIADMSAIPAERRDEFARAGLVHMLSVSGLHVAIIALALELLTTAARLPRAPARVGTMLLLAGYVAAIGAPPPAVRASVMLGLLLATRLLQRPTSVWAVLAVGGVAPLADATVVVDLGWQLSVAGTVALVAGGALARRTVPDDWRGWRRAMASAAIISVVATVVTAPLVAWVFGRVAVLGPFTNMLADPVMGALQPLLFVALCIPLAAVERVTADAAHALIALFNEIAARAADIPAAAPQVLPTSASAIAGAVIAIAVVVACLSERPARACLVALCALAAMTLEPLLALPRRDTELHMLDVGQGDALAVRSRGGRWIVIDAGRRWQGGDAGKSTVVPYIAHRGGHVALFALSHPHADHVGGAVSLMQSLPPHTFLDPGYVGTSAPYVEALQYARQSRIPWRRVIPGDSIVIDEIVLTALAPDSTWASNLPDANLASAVLVVRVGGVRMLFTGDAEGPEEEWLLANAGEALRADVLKVAHHGSRTSTTAPFLAAVRPRLALVSVGARNGYGHPAADVLHDLGAIGAQVLRTDLAGTVIVRTDGRRLEVESHGSRWSVPPRPAVPPLSP